MRNLLIILVFCLSANLTGAQFVKKKAISAQIGYGLSSPFNSTDQIVDGGFFIQGELILTVSSWAEIRPYAGFVSTNSDGTDIDGNPTLEKAESSAFLLGGKARVRAPIPWVAPYVEVGIGASIGSFETLTTFDNISKSGVIYHIPFSVGLELGRNNNFDLGFSYYFQPTVEQATGAFAIGITIPLKN